MTAPAEDHTGEDQFGPFIVEHNEAIRKKAINEVLDRAIEKFGEWYDAGFARPVTKEHVTKILETLRQQEQP